MTFYEYCVNMSELSGNSKVNIRVWRSLVSRLNGVQEAAGSNPVTRTKKRTLPFGWCSFFARDRIRTHLNAKCRWHLAATSSKTGCNHMALRRQSQLSNPVTRTRNITKVMSFFLLYHMAPLRPDRGSCSTTLLYWANQMCVPLREASQAAHYAPCIRQSACRREEYHLFPFE